MSFNYTDTNSKDKNNSYFTDLDFDKFKKQFEEGWNTYDEERLGGDRCDSTTCRNVGEYLCKLYQLSAREGKLYKCLPFKLYFGELEYDGNRIVLSKEMVSEIKEILNSKELRFSDVSVDVIDRKIIINLDTRPIEYIEFGGGGVLRELPDGKFECWEDDQWFPFDIKEGKPIKPNRNKNTEDPVS